MGLSIFTDKAKRPDDGDLSRALGEVKPLWDQLKLFVIETYPPIVEDWKHYGKNSGWTMKLLRKKRNLFFSYPGEGLFTLGFVFGEKAVQAVENSSLPTHLIEELKAARKYAEGRGLPVPIRTGRDLETAKQLIAIKVEN
ncbi:MAG: DUF3788 domain-containing protein [bacterium]|nr:DUF3788 domain-containing protein [bacterium]